ncbi:hypothetical protein HKBW3S03_00099 [Candidatus Hakubella thermalkaliphila]|uniref:Uncharacterized protein n=2 Tax=Candidatus Hakubella thermalkaliphila TaxID=2754717 RepID=A0A6V8P2U1_9ACTN|nr:hypothetical protein [Candidatus Hakubella thermalkaliphila]MBT9168350.1 hypothetical protein [Bacillota bacterium]GFP18594.1 hypothetical protein HKBW3S03_00099 [Candidatus Hakubella thermalkaliphila]GFP21352.1 hypothetical protein HKBW3S06_00578 [Candidatus Hakubella thermalkaliphila]GFP25658.1 hypothetical protein HKBW3S25_01139 [Candidatus Hakubella thermalkaliphila]GFP26667.1 hypothetical protein HKBW3S33_00082 [Candidatus Hakubella thermalkaliphila]
MFTHQFTFVTAIVILLLLLSVLLLAVLFWSVIYLERSSEGGPGLFGLRRSAAPQQGVNEIFGGGAPGDTGADGSW